MQRVGKIAALLAMMMLLLLLLLLRLLGVLLSLEAVRPRAESKLDVSLFPATTTAGETAAAAGRGLSIVCGDVVFINSDDDGDDGTTTTAGEQVASSASTEKS
jgi:hypothetical protein